VIFAYFSPFLETTVMGWLSFQDNFRVTFTMQEFAYLEQVAKTLHFGLQRWFWEIKPSVTNQKLNIKGEEYAEE
jgi:hypothetical protein